jgi:hypothetical protein
MAAPERLHIPLQGGMGGGMVGGAPRQHETMGQRVEEHMPGHHNQQASSRALCLHPGVPHIAAQILAVKPPWFCGALRHPMKHKSVSKCATGPMLTPEGGPQDGSM